MKRRAFLKMGFLAPLVLATNFLLPKPKETRIEDVINDIVNREGWKKGSIKPLIIYDDRCPDGYIYAFNSNLVKLDGVASDIPWKSDVEVVIADIRRNQDGRKFRYDKAG